MLGIEPFWLLAGFFIFNVEGRSAVHPGAAWLCLGEWFFPSRGVWLAEISVQQKGTVGPGARELL